MLMGGRIGLSWGEDIYVSSAYVYDTLLAINFSFCMTRNKMWRWRAGRKKKSCKKHLAGYSKRARSAQVAVKIDCKNRLIYWLKC